MVGRDAGRLVVGTASAVLEGDLLGKVFQGERQVRAPQPGADGYQQAQNAVARGAELIVGSYTPRYESASGNVLYNLAPTLQQVRLADGGEPLAANLDLDTALADEQRGVLLLDSERLSGFELGRCAWPPVSGSRWTMPCRSAMAARSSCTRPRSR